MLACTTLTSLALCDKVCRKISLKFTDVITINEQIYILAVGICIDM